MLRLNLFTTINLTNNAANIPPIKPATTTFPMGQVLKPRSKE
jgi:hypothetical protein